jgi:lycopene cyclase domain-containing protein
MTLISPYLFLELALLLFLLSFGWEQWRLADLFSRWFLFAAFGLACFWFAIDQLAIHLGLWAFPPGGNTIHKLMALPLEEYFMFFLHTVICLILIRHYSEDG